MENYNQLKNEADNLRKSKDYDRAIIYYEKIIEEYPDKSNEWDKWGYAYCLNRLKRYEESLEICKEVYSTNQDMRMINNLYAWNLYYTKIKGKEFLSELLDTANFIIQLVKNDRRYSPFNITVFSVLDRLNDYGMKYTKRMDYWIKLLNYEELSDKSYSYTDKKGKLIEFASDKEKYFMYKIQIEYFKQKYDSCIQVCNMALEEIDKFHYDNEIWFKRRLAQSLSKVGNFEEAIEIYKWILKQKQDWFLFGELGEIYLGNNMLDNAKKYLLKAVLSGGQFDKKVNLLMILSNVFTQPDENKLKESIFDMIYLIRKKNDWKMPEELKERNPEFDYNTLKEHLFNIFRQEYDELEPYYKGKITKIFPHGKAGFIEGEDGKSYYFLTKNVIGQKEIYENLEVKFHLVEGFDKKKNMKTMNATDISLI